MTQVRAIRGSDLVHFTKKGETDFPKENIHLIDPKGWSVVTLEFLHNDGPDWRLAMLYKFKDKEEPIWGTVTLTEYAHKNMIKTIEIDGIEEKVN